MIEENILKINKDLPPQTRLIAVSKTKPVEMLQEAYDAGQRLFGENKALEMRDKHEALPKDIEWHFIGHLQTNKVRYLMDKAVMIHSVDSAHLAKAISKEAVKAGRVMDILLEVNAAGEESKFGLGYQEVLPLVREIAPLPGIHICGLMTVAPYTEDPETNRVFFKNIRELAVDIDRQCIDNVSMAVLSMGMTGDFEVAIEEGATHIRVGTAIFGRRNYAV